jgi:hypothetical protein
MNAQKASRDGTVGKQAAGTRDVVETAIEVSRSDRTTHWEDLQKRFPVKETKWSEAKTSTG